jgi:hypothetical protein
VLATPSPLNLGYFQYPHDEVEPVSAQVTYTNRTDQTVDLALALDVASRDGAVPGSDMLSVQPDTVSLAPGASAQVTVTVDASVGEFGLYGGYLVATSDGDVVTRTPVGFYKESERYELTVEGIARDGRPAFGISSFDVVNAVDTSVFLETSNSFTNGVASLRVPPGTYSVMGVIYTYDDPQIFVTERVAVGNPQVEVTEDTTVVLDARDANEITFDTEEPTEVLSGVSLGWYRQSEQVGSHSHIHTGLQVPQFATETAPVTLGAFEFFSRHRLAGTGVLYDLVDAHPGHIPADLHVVADKDVLATLDNRFHSDVDDHVMNEVRHFWRPWAFVSVGFTTATGVPQERTEYSFGGDTRYQQQMWAEPPFTGILVEPITFYHEGEQRVQNWFRQVMRPGVIDGGLFQASTPTTPTQDQFTVRVQEWVDSDGHWGAAHTAVDVSAFRLYEDGELIAEAARPQGGFAVSPDAAEHRLEVDVDRDAPWWSTSTSTRTGWTLPAVAPPPGQTVVVPLLEVDYRTDLDLLNTAPHPRDRSGVPTIELTVRHQPGADGAAIGGARLWISYDDGQNWRERPGIDRGDGVFEFLLDNRDPAETNGFVALRVDAWDAYGNRIEQEIVRAWQLAQR